MSMNVFNKMAALAMLSTASYAAMASELNERRNQVIPQSKVAEADIAPVQQVTPVGWDRILDSKAYGPVSVRYQARAVSPDVLRSAVLG
ncbi:hypothetical protein [Pseudomonas oryzihabitans]|uniref:hypothetical protein n=1 Tax=Pseudomonas oryzihabitans TaxID=47885 RepID=UPI001F102339|nr:hypothetical protein [Pseudomonas psychrotolerans]